MTLARTPRAKLTLLYDGNCSICVASMKALLKGRAKNVTLQPLDLHSREAREAFPDFDLAALMGELHVVDGAGNVFTGARAVHEILRYQTWPICWLARAWSLPGYPALAQKFYQWFSARRYRMQR
jgi:predicted DCC family thiol-disulfide oxidoreductase YuxK